VFITDSPIQTFNRIEDRFLLSQREADIFRQDLSADFIAERHIDCGDDYPVITTYLDDPAKRCYWDKIDNVPFRRNLRIRCYPENFEDQTFSPVYLEIKQYFGQSIQKRRAAFSFEQTKQLCQTGLLPDAGSGSEILCREAASLIREYNLHPAVTILFRRTALESAWSRGNIRVTFDRELFAFPQSDFSEAKPDRCRILPPGAVILEIKSNAGLPFWLSEEINRRHFEPMCRTKYCRAIDLLQPARIHSV
jgi:hypothetical protein